MKKNHYLNWIFTFLLIFPLMLLVGCGNNNNNTKTLVAISVETKNLDSEIFEVDMLSKTITSTYDKELTTIIDNKNFNVYLRYSDNSTEKIEPVSNNNFYGYKFQTTVPDIEDGETVSAGRYSLKFIYGELSDTFVWNINKKTIDMSSADWISCANFRYNAEEYEVYVNKINEIEGIEYSYDIQGNQLKATNAGSYTAKINISYDETNYTLINAPASEYKWSIKKGNIADYIDVSNLWTYSEPFVYENGITYEVEFLKENLDDKFGLEIIDYDINLSNNKTNTAMNAGTYVAGVIVEQNDLNNWNVFNSKLLNLVWVINKKEINLGKIGVKWPNYEDAIFIYDGTQKKMELIGLEDNEFGISARYEVDISNNITSKATNSGHYISKSRFVYDNRNYILTNLPASEFGWIIEKRVLNIEDFEDAEWVYNNESLVYKPGFKHIVTLENLPSMINGVDYFKNVESNVTNMATNAGDYTAFAILDYDSNYEIDYEVQQEILTHNWTIEKASINIENKWINDAPYYYDEQSKSVSFDINQDAFNNGIVSLKGYSGITQAVQSGVYHCYAIIDVVDEDNYNQIEGNFSYSWEILNCECIEEVVLSGGGISQPKTYNQEWFENLLYIPYLNTITISPSENFYIKVNGESTNEVYAETKQGIYEIEIYRNSDDKLIFKKTLKTIIIDNVVIDNKEYYVDGNIINCESLNQLADSVCINIGKDKTSNVDYSMKFAGRLKYSYVDKDSLDTIYVNIESPPNR